jgi:hypothetical protein
VVALRPEDIAAARELGVAGVKLWMSGDCAGAIPKLTAAEQIFHAPTTLEYLGECRIKMGQLVAGTEDLRRVVREELSPNAPRAFVDAQKRAQATVAKTLPRIGALRIHVDGAPGRALIVRVDDAPVPMALLDKDRPTDPGHHQVTATAQGEGYLNALATVDLHEGEQLRVDLKILPDHLPPPPRILPDRSPPPQ